MVSEKNVTMISWLYPTIPPCSFVRSPCCNTIPVISPVYPPLFDPYPPLEQVPSGQGRHNGLTPCLAFGVHDVKMISTRNFNLDRTKQCGTQCLKHLPFEDGFYYPCYGYIGDGPWDWLYKKMHLYSPCLLVVSSCVPIMVHFSDLT
jgi:hypothetical protein